MSKIKFHILIIICFLHTNTSICQEISKDYSSFQIELQGKDDKTKIEILIENAHKLKSEDLKESTFYYEYALVLAEQNNYNTLIQYISFALAKNYKHAASYHYALKYFIRYGEISALMKDTANMGTSFHYQGEILYLQNKYKEAEICYKKAIELYTQLNKFKEIGYCYNNMGLLYNKTNLNKALEYYTKAYELRKQHGNINTCGLFLNNMACIHIYKGELEKAKLILDSALNITQNSENHRNLAYIYSSYGEYYQAKKQYNLAEKAYKKSIKTHSSNSHIGGRLNILLLISHMYEEISDHKSALKYYRQHVEIQDSITKINDIKLYSKQEFANKIRQLNYDKNQEIFTQKKKNYFYFILILFLGLLLISAIIIFYLKKRLEVKKIKLSKENKTLKENLLLEKIENKNKELTSKAILLSERNELIKNVSEKLNSCKPKLKKTNLDVIQSIIDDLNSKVNEKQWSDLQHNFNNLHPNFYKNLLSDFPSLSPKELKTCSFLKLNMSSKEIASITHISPNSVEVSRSRLRKKLELSNSNISFFVFLSKY